MTSKSARPLTVQECLCSQHGIIVAGCQPGANRIRVYGGTRASRHVLHHQLHQTSRDCGHGMVGRRLLLHVSRAQSLQQRGCELRQPPDTRYGQPRPVAGTPPPQQTGALPAWSARPSRKRPVHSSWLSSRKGADPHCSRNWLACRPGRVSARSLLRILGICA